MINTHIKTVLGGVMAHTKLWGTTVSRNALLTTTKESHDFSHGEC